MGETINLVNNFKVEKVIFNCGEFNDSEQELIKVLDKNKLYFFQTNEYDIKAVIEKSKVDKNDSYEELRNKILRDVDVLKEMIRLILLFVKKEINM